VVLAAAVYLGVKRTGDSRGVKQLLGHDRCSVSGPLGDYHTAQDGEPAYSVALKGSSGLHLAVGKKFSTATVLESVMHLSKASA